MKGNANGRDTISAATAAGVVKERSYDENGYGWLLKVDHGDGWETRWGGCTNSLLERLLERFIA